MSINFQFRGHTWSFVYYVRNWQYFNISNKTKEERTPRTYQMFIESNKISEQVASNIHLGENRSKAELSFFFLFLFFYTIFSISKTTSKPWTLKICNSLALCSVHRVKPCRRKRKDEKILFKQHLHETRNIFTTILAAMSRKKVENRRGKLSDKCKRSDLPFKCKSLNYMPDSVAVKFCHW